MLYYLSQYLQTIWGPFRLLGSHLMLLSVGTMLAGLITWFLLPKLWHVLPTDRCKNLAADGGGESKGKPTGAGLIFTLLLLPCILLFVPLSVWGYLTLLSLYACMYFGYADDASKIPWGELKKGLLDLLVAVAAAFFIYKECGSTIWIPFTKATFHLPVWLYVFIAVCVLWLTMNATNCSDGVDGLAGSLSLMSLASLAILLYAVIGYAPIAKYLLIPTNPLAARWAILAMVTSGTLAGYLWYNADPSRVLMGDAGSRFLGMLVGIEVLISGNPFFVFVVATVVLANGGTGLFKIALLRIFRIMGFDARDPKKLSEEQKEKQFALIKVLHIVRFPLHDHFRAKKGWSKGQVLLRFLLIQSFLTPLLFILLIKIR
ncbi:MAG: phospho-N-acetylmuramoyl-pentapeptide-transferase [Kiritimatiellae bacterium]|nr:phospho-N-acetylmuramoyl-pentapeptide-transferase [Kiritimatiellia bacterium]